MGSPGRVACSTSTDLFLDAFSSSGQMADGSLCVSWCRAVACALALVAADGLLVDITYVETAVAKGAGERSSASSPIPFLPPPLSSSCEDRSVFMPDVLAANSVLGWERAGVSPRPRLRLRREQLAGSF